MTRIQFPPIARLALALLCIAAFLTPADGQDGLKTIDNSGSGQILYGPLTGQSSLQGAMLTMLRKVHSRFGERPQIGKFYQARGSNSLSTFFTLTAKTQGGKRISGMVIVSASSPNQPVNAAVLYDDANRFGATWSVMMKKLNQAWHQDYPQPVKSSQTASASASPHPVPPLRKTRFPDGSGIIGLPEGWKITSAGAGSVRAAGPNGEEVALAVIWQMYDPTNQAGRGLIKYLTLNGRPFPAGSAIYPCCNLLGAWLAAAQQSAQQQRLPIPTFHLTSSSQTPPGQYESDAIVATGDLDYHNGKGPLGTRLRLSRLGKPGGTYGLDVQRLSVPTRLADQEWPTIEAIVSSMGQNGQVIQQQVNSWIHDNNVRAENGRRLVAQQSATNDERNRDIETNRDEMSKRYKAFENYQLDRTVIQDNDTGNHGTTGNANADWLVRNYPDRFQYVPTQDFIKPADY